MHKLTYLVNICTLNISKEYVPLVNGRTLAEQLSYSVNMKHSNLMKSFLKLESLLHRDSRNGFFYCLKGSMLWNIFAVNICA